MKKLLIATAALGALATAAPAAAQYTNQNSQGAYGNVNAGGGMGLQNRIARLDARIQAGVQAGTIDRTEARTLRMQLRDITRLERQYSRNGLSQQERQDLQMRVRNFRDQLAMADGRRGNDQYGYGDGGAYGQGGPYDAYCEDNGRQQQGGLGGIIDSIFGGGNNNDRDCDTGVRVGQRVSGNLYAVPSNLRSRYRDGGGVYYRSDGRNILQIDARTQTVLRVYDLY
ncbi:MAG TPA: hypothetical protein VGB48_00795 [Allosphingosinicella sp.]|jgi:hypothetical protein